MKTKPGSMPAKNKKKKKEEVYLFIFYYIYIKATLNQGRADG